MGEIFHKPVNGDRKYGGFLGASAGTYNRIRTRKIHVSPEKTVQANYALCVGILGDLRADVLERKDLLMGMIHRETTLILQVVKNPFVLSILGVAFLYLVIGLGILGTSLAATVLSLLFILVIPALIYEALRKIVDPVPFWLTLLPVIPVIGLFSSSHFGGEGLLENIILPFTLLFLLTSLAVIGPYPLFEKKLADKPWKVFPLASFTGVALFFVSSMGESLAGQPLPTFFSKFPLSGWIFDGLANLLNLQDAVYGFNSHVYTILWTCSFYLEVFFIAFLYYAMLGWLSSARANPGGA